MKIASLTTYSNRTLSFVRLRTDDGAEGWGQMSPYNADITTTVFHRQVAPHTLGASLDDLDGLLERILEAEYKFPGSYVCRALCGLDTAIWDLRGKVLGRSSGNCVSTRTPCFASTPTAAGRRTRRSETRAPCGT